MLDMGDTVLDEKQMLDVLRIISMEMSACLTTEILSNRHTPRDQQWRNIYGILSNGYTKYAPVASILKAREYGIFMILETEESNQLNGMYVHIGTLHHLTTSILENSLRINKELSVRLEIRPPMHLFRKEVMHTLRGYFHGI